MGKTLIDTYGANNSNGVMLPGETIHCYPFGTTDNDAHITDNDDGTYTILLDPATYGNGVIARYYDIYNGVTLKLQKRPIGVGWVWFATLAVDTSPKEVLFSDLKDENVEDLPATINNAKVEIIYAELGRGFFLTATSDTGFTICAQESRDDNADLPINVHLKICVGEN